MSDSKKATSPNASALIDAIVKAITPLVHKAVVEELGTHAAIVTTALAKQEAMLQDVLDRLDRIQAMDSLQAKMAAGEMAALCALPEKKTGRSRAAPAAAAGKPKRIVNSMHYFKKMWSEDVEFRKRFLSSSEFRMDTKAAADIGVYAGEPVADLTPERKLELETAFAERAALAGDAATARERKSNALKIWRTGLSAGLKELLKSECTKYNETLAEAARPAPLETDRQA